MICMEIINKSAINFLTLLLVECYKKKAKENLNYRSI